MSNTRRLLSRRTVLRGAGVALTLPWLESLNGRSASAQNLKPPLRFLPVYLPNGAPDFWKPQASGAGSAWAPSSVLAPLLALKSKVAVISGLENGSVFNADGSSTVEPPHGRQAGAWLTCADAVAVRQALGVNDANGVSVDQLVAADAAFGGSTGLASLQVGLSSLSSACDGQPCSLARSVSWKTPTEALYKGVDPHKVFEQLFGAATTGPDADAAKKRQLARQSVLDAVLESTNVVRKKLAVTDQARIDQFLDSVREVEKQVQLAPAVRGGCQLPSLPSFPAVGGANEFRSNGAGYSKDRHAELMNRLIVMAFQCDITRVISYMLEDESSEFVYDNVPLRKFDATTSSLSTGVCGEYAGAQHGNVDEYASITSWNVGRVAELCDTLSLTPDVAGGTLLDSCVVFLGSGMHGSNHACADLPALLIGNAGGALKTDQHLALSNRPLRDLYFTLMNGVFGMSVKDFGANETGAGIATISELLS
jgi:hypothetical protein